MAIEAISVKAKNYQSFGEEYTGYEEIRPLNLIIGKNNTGKSTLIDLVEYMCNPSPRRARGHQGRRPEFIFHHRITESYVDTIFTDANSGVHGYVNDRLFGHSIVGQDLVVNVDEQGHLQYYETLNQHLFSNLRRKDTPFENTYSKKMIKGVANPFNQKRFFRLSADRNINRETRSGVGDGSWLKSNGDGATNLIRHVVTNDAIDDRLVNIELVNALNEIYGDDGQFTRVIPQENDSGEWEIFLEEEKKGKLVPLSNSGSSLKTVILTLLNLLVLPRVLNVELSSCVFAIEEPENNLHPALQRRLVQYILKFQSENNSTFFISTHSNILIDIFSNNEVSQVLHVRHDKEKSSVTKVKTYTEHADLIEDLDFRASDVLQANGVIWVEGPSDRIYLKKWINIISNGEVLEDLHYQFVMYGGSLLKHLNADDPDLVESAISVLRINKNSIVVMDSDKSRAGDNISVAKQSVIDALADNQNCMTFLTAGRDIENYLPPSVIQAHYGLEARPRRITLFRKFEDYLDSVVRSGEGTKFNRNKSLYAQTFADLITNESEVVGHDLRQRIEEIVVLIKRWNRL